MKPSKLILVIMTIFTQAGHALVPETEVSHSFRYRNEYQKTQAQQGLALKLGLNFTESFKIVGVGRNGASFNSRFDSFFNSAKKTQTGGVDSIVENFAVRNIYFEGLLDDKISLQFGALPILKSTSYSTALEKGGWIDGLRGKKKTSYGDFFVTAGSLNDRKQPNAFLREHRLNYFEFLYKRKTLLNNKIELGFVAHEGVEYLKIANSSEVAILSERLINLVGELMISDDGDMKLSAGINGDLINALSGWDSGVKFDLRTNFADEDLNDIATSYTSGFKNSVGHYLTAALKKKMPYGFSGQARYRKSYDKDIEDGRFEINISKVF